MPFIIMAYYYVCMALASFVILLYSYTYSNKNKLPTNWPLIGMLPALSKNLHRLNDYILEITKSQSTFLFKGPWFTNMHILITVDPANVQHVLIKNFGNYHKGHKYNEIFEVFGEGVLNTDADIWQYHRKMAQCFITHPRFHQFLFDKIWEKIDDGLIPVLEHVCKQGLEVDLQDVFSRFTFDNICTMIMGHDPRSLSSDFPSVPPSKALDEAEQVILNRYALPTFIWKFQRWLGIGLEKKYKESWQTLDNFIYKCIAHKRQEMSQTLFKQNDNKEVGVDILTLYMGDENSDNDTISKKGDKFLRDTVLAFLIAGRDTTTTALSWFFYLLSRHPRAVSKIKEELDTVMGQATHKDEKGQCSLSRNFKEVSDKLVYLHGALCEALRLYPPVVFEGKAPMESDILPSGHQVDPNTQIAFNLYAMARIKSIWGDDCCEFKPERWITEKGDVKYEPSHKFLAFNAGPRTCLGKNIAFVQMKAVAASIIKNYNIQVVEGHPIVPDFSIILRMKYGLKVKVLSSK